MKIYNGSGVLLVVVLVALTKTVVILVCTNEKSNHNGYYYLHYLNLFLTCISSACEWVKTFSSNCSKSAARKEIDSVTSLVDLKVIWKSNIC